MTKKPKLVSSNPGLEVSNLRKSLSGKQIVRNISMKVEKGKVIGLLGPNGAGKSTALYCIMGLISCDSGEIKLNNYNITTLPMWKRAKAGLGYLPQQPSIFRGLSVENNIMAILETTKLNLDQRINRLEELLAEFNLTHLRNAMPHQLSGGERRKCECARLLGTNPSYVLFDEPFSALDPISINDIKSEINRLKTKGISVIITDHQVREVLDISDYSYLLFSGEIIAHGTSEKILGSKEARKFYLGDTFKF
ncbi:LPS export ABC transporter ATP-binding protein [Pelagibacteraceae bacterium]|nr:LPS export ABC transporter ATP-binding protein [Pelagibacteraceae bacterium]